MNYLPLTTNLDNRPDNPSVLVGRTAVQVTTNNTVDLLFDLDDGRRFAFTHRQDCCEDVEIEDIAGDLRDLEGTPLVMVEQVDSSDEPPRTEGYTDDSYTWTFYKFATIRGYVTVRWYGTSNGYYSEDVDFEQRDNWTTELPADRIAQMHVNADYFESIGEHEQARLWREHAAKFNIQDP